MNTVNLLLKESAKLAKPKKSNNSSVFCKMVKAKKKKNQMCAILGEASV